MVRKIKSRNEVSSDSENLEEPQSNKKNMSQNLGKPNEMVDVSKFSSPTFNIHIHVPPYNMSSSKIYLPRIQPVIHLHFDEIARKLEMNQNEKVEESWGKAIETLLPIASPRFGDVKFHFNNKSGDRDLKKTNETPRSTRTQCNDCQLNRRKDKQKIQSNTSKRRKMACEQSDNESSLEVSKNIREEMLLSKYKDLNLKKARVLLTDICKSKTGTNVTLDTTASNCDEIQNENSSPENEKENNDEDVEHERFPFKEENLSPTPSSTSNESYEFDNTLENDCSTVKIEEIKVSTSTVQDMIANNKNLTALVEGCNFSEILNRFRANCKQHITNTTISPGEMDVNCNNSVNEDCFTKATTSNTNFEENNYDSHSDIINTKLESDKNVADENISPSLLRDDRFSVEGKNFVRESDEETVYFEFPGIRNCEADTKSDKLSFTPEKHSNTEEAIMDSGTLEFTSSYKINSDCEGNFKVSEMQNSCSFDVGNVDFHLHLIKKEMKRRSQMSSGSSKNVISKTRKKSNANSVKCNKSSTSKRMKPSDKKSQEKPSKSSSTPTKDYIPLNASGSTKFAVAPLDMINPYKTHSAKNFKKDMLFGNRVTRFSSSEKLRFYQMKQAARRSLNK